MVAMESLTDLSLIDFVGLEEQDQYLPQTDDPIGVFAFVADLAAKRVREVEEAKRIRKENRLRWPALQILFNDEKTQFASRLKRRKKDSNPKPKRCKSKKIKSKQQASMSMLTRSSATSQRRNSLAVELESLKLSDEEAENEQMDIESASVNSLHQVTDGESHKRKKRAANSDPEPPSALSESFREKIASIGGMNPVLVLQKGLYKTDLEKHQNRLSIPVKSVNNQFLTNEEMALLSTRGDDRHCTSIKTDFLDTKGNHWTMPLRKWPMRKKRGQRTSCVYALTDPWIKMALNEDNRLKIGDVVQLWAFRVAEKLGLALVKLISR